MRDLLSKLDAIVSETELKNPEDLQAKRKALQDLQMDPVASTDPEIKQAIIQRKADLAKEAKVKGFDESFELDREELKPAHDKGYADAAKGITKNPFNPDSPAFKSYREGQQAYTRSFGESIFQIGDSFGISFSEDFEIGSEIVGFVADGIVIELDDHAIDMLTNEGLQFFEGELVEDIDEGRGTCWVGYEQKGMKKKGSKMVANCVKEDEVAESGLQYHTGVKKHGKEYMVKAAAAGREGASQEELGRLKDRYSKAEKNKPQKEDHGPENPNASVNYGEYDREGDMAKDDLRTMDDAVEELYSILTADENLPEWVQSKITKAVDYIDTARDYMKAQKYEEDFEEGLPQTLRKVVPGYAKREIDKKMDDQKFGRTDVDRDANYYRYKKIQDKIKDKGVAEGDVTEAEYQGRTVQLGKKMAGDVKKSKVYVKNPQGNVVKVNFGDKKMRIKKSNPARRKSFRARHNCANPGPRHKARYWSCRSW